MKDWVAGGVTDMLRRQRFLEPVAQPLATMNTLALQVQEGPGREPHAGELFCFRGRKGDLVKILWHDGVGMSRYLKRLEAGKFIWPVSGPARLSKSPRRSWAIFWKASTGTIHDGRNGLKELDKLH